MSQPEAENVSREDSKGVRCRNSTYVMMQEIATAKRLRYYDVLDDAIKILYEQTFNSSKKTK